MTDAAVQTSSPEPSSPSSKDLFGGYGIAIVVAIFMVEGLFRTAYFYLNELAEEKGTPLVAPLINEMTGAAAMIVVFYAVVVPMARRFPFWGPRWKAHFPATLLGLALFSVVKTLLMWGMRIPLWAVAGLGAYDYGVMAFRFPMEAANDVFSYFLFLGIVQFWDAWVARQERQLREARLETMLHESRLRALQGQLQPHFLFNTLNTISSVMYQDPAQADRLMARLSDLLRSSLSAPERPEVGLEEELEILDRYVELMSARFGDRLTVEVSVSPEARGSAVPVFLLQPLVENAIKHGVASRAGPGTVDVEISRAGDELRVTVRDDGPGIYGDPEQAVGKGVGLRNTGDRLTHLYGDAAGLSLRNGEESGLSVAVHLPYRDAETPETRAAAEAAGGDSD